MSTQNQQFWMLILSELTTGNCWKILWIGKSISEKGWGAELLSSGAHRGKGVIPGGFKDEKMELFGKIDWFRRERSWFVKRTKTCKKGVDSWRGWCYNHQCCRENSDASRSQRQRRSLKTIQRKVILYKKNDTGAPEGATIVSTVRFLMSETLWRNDGRQPLWRVVVGSQWVEVKDWTSEFDPGSGRTLAACLTHASRAGIRGFGPGF